MLFGPFQSISLAFILPLLSTCELPICTKNLLKDCGVKLHNMLIWWKANINQTPLFHIMHQPLVDWKNNDANTDLLFQSTGG